MGTISVIQGAIWVILGTWEVFDSPLALGNLGAPLGDFCLLEDLILVAKHYEIQRFSIMEPEIGEL